MATLQDMILEQLKKLNENMENLRDKFDELFKNGCSKASDHTQQGENFKEIFARLRKVEDTQAESRGKLIVISAICAALFTLLCQWIGKHVF